ncbi:S9 family peptidase [Asticcacaulis sp. YBE204]|uniref:S9 family peptidase n=1 Tax=Asticcacaulis sp. YBE204 TaxID=1282363 RepID=UPI0003C3F917|nr:S9 family peptidase [Asticcacaulis sp. YBE204]ESQ80397.1 hypothetical protein AEYBE204_03790 [Asticcacaulis sp. YBE204]
MPFRHVPRLHPLVLSALCLTAAPVMAPITAHAAKPPAAKPIATPVKDITDPKSLVSPANPNARPVPLKDLTAVRAAPEAVWTPDGKHIVLATNIAGRINIWKLSEGEMTPVQLSESENPQSNLFVSPDGQTVYFLSDIDGKEIFDLYALPINGGDVVNLTDTPDLTERGARPSLDGKLIAFSIRPRDSAISNVAVMDVASRKVRVLTDEKDGNWFWFASGFTPDGKYIIAHRNRSDDSAGTPWLIEVATGKAVMAVPSKDTEATYIADVSPDGKWLALSTNAGTGQFHAALYNRETFETKRLKATPWEQMAQQFSPDGKYLIVSNNADGRGTLDRVDLATLTETPLRIDPGFVGLATSAQSSFNPVTGKLLVNRDAGDSPLDYWTVDLSGTEPAKRITRLAIASLDPVNLPKNTIVHYKSFDGTPISAVVTMPFNLKRDGSNPAIVMPHGGPTGQSQDYFSKYTAALASRGYIVIQPNFRGSTGYGLPFQLANQKDLGNGDLKDVMGAVEFLKATGYVDAKKIGITGGSYGGYMTLMAIGKYPDSFAAAVQQFGIINWYTMWENGDAGLREYQRALLGDPVTHKALYDAASPMTYAKSIKTPLLTLQGENDARVPKNQAAEVVERVKANGTTTEVVYYPAEGHGFRKKENAADALSRVVAWFEKYLPVK